MLRKDAICNQCAKVEEINFNYGKPNEWFEVTIKVNDSERNDLHFCSKKCFIDYINNLK